MRLMDFLNRASGLPMNVTYRCQLANEGEGAHVDNPNDYAQRGEEANRTEDPYGVVNQRVSRCEAEWPERDEVGIRRKKPQDTYTGRTKTRQVWNCRGPGPRSRRRMVALNIRGQITKTASVCMYPSHLC